LKDDGLLVIAVPNVDSFAAKVFKENWYQLEIPIHLIAFSPDSITRMLDTAGFKIKKSIMTDAIRHLVVACVILRMESTGCFLSWHASKY